MPDRAPEPRAPEPRVRLAWAVLAVLAAVVLALVAVSAVIRIDSQPLAGGPALPPPAPTTADPYAIEVNGSEVTYQQLQWRLPGAPFSCSPPADPPPSILRGYLGCDAAVHRNYNAAGDDWYAQLGIGIPQDAQVDPTSIKKTADRVFDLLQRAFYDASTKPEVTGRTGSVVQSIGTSDTAYAVYADVKVTARGLATTSDRLLVIAVRLPSGQTAFFFSARPDDSGEAIKTSAATSFGALTVR